MSESGKIRKAREELGRTIESLPKAEASEGDFLSTGLTLINLAATGHPTRGVQKGHIYRVAGKSSSGKTFLCRTILAEAACSESFNGHELIYDDVEWGALMDTEKFFGKRLVARLVPPARTKSKQPIYSESIGDFYRRIRARLEAGKKIVWVEDSLDSLSPESENKMTDGKAKINSQELRKLVQPLKDTGSILILVSQVRQDMHSLFGGDITAGGNAPEFYSTLDIRLSRIKTIKVTHKGKKYNQGSYIQARIKKNRLSGQDASVVFPFYPSLGLDDTGSMIDFLTSNKHWTKGESGIQAPEFEFHGSKKSLIAHVEEQRLYSQLQQVTAGVWQEIQIATRVDRKSRYD